MKFKVIFLLFNAVLVVAFLVIYLMPLFVIGWDYAKLFWASDWYLPVIFFAIIGALNLYFALNWRLFILLEREDWAGIVRYLETQVFEKNRLRRQYVRILINGYLVNSNTEGIGRLERLIREKKPALVGAFALSLGIPYLLKNEPAEMERYFGAFVGNKRVAKENWISWNHAFALMLLKRREEARETLVGVARRSREPVLLLLSYYLLDAFSNDDPRVERLLEEGKASLKKRFSPILWQKELDRAKDEVEVVLLSKLVQEATEWLFAFGAVGDPKVIH